MPRFCRYSLSFYFPVVWQPRVLAYSLKQGLALFPKGTTTFGLSLAYLAAGLSPKYSIPRDTGLLAWQDSGLWDSFLLESFSLLSQSCLAVSANPGSLRVLEQASLFFYQAIREVGCLEAVRQRWSLASLFSGLLFVTCSFFLVWAFLFGA